MSDDSERTVIAPRANARIGTKLNGIYEIESLIAAGGMGEVYRGRAILYGCGDLVNDYEGIAPHGSLRSDLGCLYLLALSDDGALQRLEIVPLQLRRFRLQRADAGARAWLRRVFDEEGRALGTRVEEAEDGRFALRWD